MKKTLMKTLTFVLVLCMMTAAIPFSVFAASAKENECTVTYYTDEAGTPIGIKKVQIGDQVYYDCSGGMYAELNENYLKNVLTTEYKVDENTSITILEQWANIAAAIFENGGKYTCCPDDNGDDYDNLYGKNFSNKSDENCYVGGLLADPESNEGGEKGDDYYHSTGLTYTTSLSEVRTAMGNEIAKGVDRRNCSGSDILGQGTCDSALPQLNDETKQTVLYNIVTSVGRDGKTPKYRYNSYGIAFYDFSISVLADENLQYVTNPGSASGDLTVGNVDTETTYIASQVNNTAKDSSMEFSLENTTSETISSSMQNGSTYTFGESIGVEAGFSGIGFSTGFSCEEAFSSILTDEKSSSHSTGSTVTTSCVVPAYTQAILKQEYGSSTSELSYDVPVVLNFKVAIFSMSGDVYADGCGVCTMSTHHYSQSYFYTSFGENNTNAYESLDYRVNTNSGNNKVNGGDSKNGETYVFFERHLPFENDKDSKSNYDIDWKNVETTYEKNTGSTLTIGEFSKMIPMLSTGVTSTITCTTCSTEISEYKPLYLPSSVRITNLNEINTNLMQGSTYNLNKICLDAFNRYDGSYYGFVYGDGHWEVCEGSEDVLKITPGTNTITVIGEPGETGCVQWVLNDDVEYTSVYDQGSVTSEDIEPVIVQFSVYGNPLLNN